MNPVSILIHSGAPNDAKLFDEIMENLQKRRIIEKGDIIIFDKGYYSYKNYHWELANIKLFLSFFQKIISTKQSSMTNYPIHYKYLRKQKNIGTKTIL